MATVAKAVTWRGTKPEVFKLANLSPGGAFIRYSERCDVDPPGDVQVGERLPMRIVTPSVCSVPVQAECVRLASADEPPGFAVRFSERQQLDPLLVESLCPQ